MQQVSKLHNYKITKLPNPQRGYMLITLMLMLTLAAMAILALWPAIGQQIKRDQEEELRHRGTSYMRAIQHFYKKFGRYPTRIEELEETNKIRFLRHRYKDPMSRDPQTGKERDFKILHMQDVNLNNGPVLGQQPGAPNQLPNNPGSPVNTPALGPTQPAAGATEDTPNSSGNPQNPNNAENDNESEPAANNQPNSPGAPNSPPPFSTSPNATSPPQGAGNGFSSTVFGGGPILGVASTSKATTIREFNKKNHYKDWLFIYDPTSDRGGLLVGPWQTLPAPNLQGGTPAGTPLNGLSQPNSGPTPTQQPQPPQTPPQQEQQ